MAKLAFYHGVGVFLTLLINSISGASVMGQYPLHIQTRPGDTALQASGIVLTTSFPTKAACAEYVAKLPEWLHAKGFLGASVDQITYDSGAAVLDLYIGERYRWLSLRVDSADRGLITELGIELKGVERGFVDLDRIRSMREKILRQLEEEGYPFARVRFESFREDQGGVSAQLQIERGPLYKIDSIHIEGTAKISNRYLQRYLGISNGSLYRQSVLQAVSKRFEESAFLREQQPWSLTRLGTGSVLNVYLEPRRSSQVNVLVGLLPATNTAASIYDPPRNNFQLTGEAYVNLRNALGSGEVLGINWQQLQLKSPRLNLLFEQPYLFGSPFGVRMAFDLFKKDTSFVNINLFLGASYALRTNSSGMIFLQQVQSNLITVDTQAVKTTRQLPREADLRTVSLGVHWEGFATDYRYNPVSGNEWLLNLSAGTKTMRKNNGILQLKDASDPGFDFKRLYDTVKLKSYQFRLKLYGAHFFRLTRVSTLKAALNLGWFQSPVTFRNELFQIGGYRLLRGFDEESIYASRYAVGTAEYRYLIGRNSNLFTFFDAGWTLNDAGQSRQRNSYWGAGMGISLETKGGMIQLSLAAGKRNDLDFSLRQAKIHLGYVNFF